MERITKAGELAVKDRRFRIFLIASLSMTYNFIYAIFNGVVGMVSNSIWLMTLTVYYCVLGWMRLVLIYSERRREDRRLLRRSILFTGFGLIFLAVILSGVTAITLHDQIFNMRSEILMIAIATFTFFLMGNAIRNIVIAVRERSQWMITLRNISCASAIGAMFSLERSMLATFGEATDRYSYWMVTFTGLGVFLLVLALGVSTILLAGKPNAFENTNSK